MFASMCSAVHSSPLINDRSLRFFFRRPARPSIRAQKLVVIGFGLVAALALLSNFGSVTATLRDWLSSSRDVPLDQQLATQFPSLKASLASRSTGFDRTTRTVDGREVAGLTARVTEAKTVGSSGATTGMPGGLKPVEQEA